jgi:glycosyltransferase involved in cell wall biosynthesis
MTLVSIIIPCYNVENYVAECLDSALQQTYTNTEIICVENNSTDNTFSIVKDYAARYLGKITLLQETKQGAPAARNKGLTAAQGEWIQFLDADDRLLPGKIERQVEEIEKSGESFDIIISPLTRVLVSSKIVHIEIAPEVWAGLITSRAGSTCSNLYKKDILTKINGWDETRVSSQEAWLLFALLKNNAKVKLFDKDETIVNERSSGSISKTNRSGNWERYLVFRKEIWDYLKEKGKLTPALEAKLKGYIFDSIRMIYKENPRQACKLFLDVVKPNFFPVPSDATSKKYILIYRLLGFSATEKLFSICKP